MTGSLTNKNGKYYVIVRIPNENGKSKQKWIPTGISSKGNNRRKAERKRIEILAELERDLQKGILSDNILFIDWIEYWMKIKENTVRVNTLEGYRYYIEKHIKPYFGEKNLALRAVTAQDIQDYYEKKLSEGLSASTIIKHNAIISGALQEAVRKKKVYHNPAKDAVLPKRERFSSKAYSFGEAERILRAVENEPIKPAVILGLYYGLRRSEVCGLRWRDIDFDAGTIRVCNTVVRMKTLVEHEKTKSNASKRTMFLVPETIPYLRSLKEQQEKYKKRMGNKYEDPQEHVCTHSNGKPFSPDYVSHEFGKLLERHNLPRIRFHELRHTTGSLLLEKGATIKQIQEYLGHEDVSTTLNIYAHLSVEGKKETALTMGSMFKTAINGLILLHKGLDKES